MTIAIGLLLIAPLVIAVVVVVARDPVGRLLPAYAALLPFGAGVSLPLGLPPQFTSLSSLTGLVLTVTLAVRLCDPANWSGRLPITAPVWVLLLGLCCVSTVWSIVPGDSFSSMINISGVVVLFLLVAANRIEPADRLKVEHGLLAGGLVACTYGLYQAATGTLPTDGPTSAARFGSDLIGDNHIASALLLPLAVALHRIGDGRPGALRRVAYGVAVLVLMSGIVLSGSRGGLICAAVTFVVVASLSRGRSLLLGVGGVAVAAVLAVLLSNPAGIGGRQASTDDSGRSDIWRVGMTACATYCDTGSGWATFPEVYERTQASVPGAAVLVRGVRYEPHNNWLLFGVELGLAGLVVMTAGLALTVREGLRLPAPQRAGPLGALVGVLSTGVLLSNFEFKYFWFALTFVTIVSNSVASDVTRPMRRAFDRGAVARGDAVSRGDAVATSATAGWGSR